MGGGRRALTDHLGAALYFEDRAERERRPEERARLLTVAREFRWLAMAEAQGFIRKMLKRPVAASVRRTAKRRRA
jgi:hypothetical protein